MHSENMKNTMQGKSYIVTVSLLTSTTITTPSQRLDRCVVGSVCAKVLFDPGEKSSPFPLLHDPFHSASVSDGFTLGVCFCSRYFCCMYQVVVEGCSCFATLLAFLSLASSPYSITGSGEYDQKPGKQNPARGSAFKSNSHYYWYHKSSATPDGPL